MYTCTKQTPNEHSSANLVCLLNGFVKNCLTTAQGKCEQTNCHIVIGVEQTSFDVHSIYRRLRERYWMWMKALTIAHSLLLYHPHIPILGKRMCLFAIAFIRLKWVYLEGIAKANEWWWMPSFAFGSFPPDVGNWANVKRCLFSTNDCVMICLLAFTMNGC